MAALSYLKLSNALACQGVTQAIYGVLRTDALSTASDVRAVEDQESLAFSVTRLDRTGAVRPIVAQLRPGRVVTIVWDDGNFDEWRIAVVTQGRGERGIISVACVPLWLDLVERSDSPGGKGWVSDLSAGTRNFEYAITQRTPSSIFSTYVIPNCPPWVGLGTIDPTFVIPSLSVSRLTPGALALAVRDALRNVDVPCELRLRQNGTTNYLLDLVTQIGSAAAIPVFHPGNALLTLQQKSDATLQATRILVKGANNPDGFPGEWGVSRWRGAAPVGNVIALTDRSGGGSPIQFDNEFVDPLAAFSYYLLRVKTGGTFPITASNAAAGTVTLDHVSTIAADEDFEFRFTEPFTNTRSTSTRYAISAVPDGTHLTLAVSTPILVDGQYVDWYARVWTLAAGGAIVRTTRITGSVAATDVIAVATSAGVTAAHFVEFIQLDGAGERPAYVDHPLLSAPPNTGYGIKTMELAKQMLGVAQLVKNSWMRAWTNPANPPDGWTVPGGGGGSTLTQNTNAAFTRYGGASWKFVSAAPSILQAPPIYITSDHGAIALRCLVYYTRFQGGATATLSVFPLNADGTGGLAWFYAASVDSLDTVGGANPRVDIGTWIELKIEGVPLGPTTAPYGIGVQFTPSTGGGNIGYLDTIEAYPFGTSPSDSFEFGDATALLQSANRQLDLVAAPPLSYTATVLDLERVFAAEYPRLALTALGGNVRLADTEYGMDVTVRLLTRARDLLQSSNTTLTLANRPTLLTALASASSARQQRIVNAIVGGTAAIAPAPAFVALTAPTTLPVGAEIQVALAGAPIVSLVAPPAGVTPMGSAVTFVPANPATTPKTTITVGTPPSRVKLFTPV